MKVSFGRILPITSDTIQNANSKRRVDNSTYEIAKVLNSEKSTVYSRKESQNIRDFFKEVLGDYDGQNGILMKKSQTGDVFLISGKDAEKLRNETEIDGYIEKYFHNQHKKGKESEVVLSSVNPQKGKTKFNLFQYLNTKTYYTAMIDGHILDEKEPTNRITCENKCPNYIVNYKELILG